MLVMRRTLVTLCMVAVGTSGSLLALGAMVALSELHIGTASMVRHAQAQLLLGANAVLWTTIAAIGSWRDVRLGAAGLIVVSGQLCMWELQRYQFAYVWSVIPKALISIALASVPVGWLFLLVRARSRRLRTAAG